MSQLPSESAADFVDSNVGADMLRRAGRADLIVDQLNPNRFSGDPPGTWAGDRAQVPIWAWTLTQAFQARYVPPELTLSGALALVENDAERRDGLAAMARLNAFRPGDVIVRLLEWQEQARAQGGAPPTDPRK